MKSSFASYHPLVNFLYFVTVLFCSMYFIHPLCLTASLAGAFAWSVYLKGKRALKFNLLYMIPSMAIMALMNPLFNHEGVTILEYLPTGNPLTLESIVYGFAAAGMFAAVICWFSCYNEVITTDKFIYLFGRTIPSLSLLMSMALRFVPRCKAQLKQVSNGQKCVGRDVSNGSLFQRARHGVKILSIMVTWVLENSIETADSMKSRGYGTTQRTAFSNYRFDNRDKAALAAIGAMAAYILLAASNGHLYFRYFPSIKTAELSPWSAAAFCVYILMCNTALIMDKWEERKWKHLKSQT